MLPVQGSVDAGCARLTRQVNLLIMLSLAHDITTTQKRDALTPTVHYLNLPARICKRHTFRKKGPQSHRSKGFSYDSGVARTKHHGSVVSLHVPPQTRRRVDPGALIGRSALPR
jgi:hypothetical protein